MNAYRAANVFLSLALWATAAHSQPPRDPLDRPNFIVLFMDDLGYGDCGFTGHPTTATLNIDQLAMRGKVLTSWYSGCAVCSGSRAALMTGRQYARTGVPGVLGPTGAVGLPLNETTVAEQLKLANYSTAAVGKWHLGNRRIYLPGNRGFDYYLGIPYSDDMGKGYHSSCSDDRKDDSDEISTIGNDQYDWNCDAYAQTGYVKPEECDTTTRDPDPAGQHLPLVYQEHNKTRVVEQPLDFTTLAQKYEAFATDFIERNKDDPFFLYVPFSHVHVTLPYNPHGNQYAGCSWQNTTTRGPFGDALAEADGIVGAITKKLEDLNLEENTMVLFASDNGPWLIQGLSGGSAGLFTGRYADYWNTGKASTWEGGIRSPSFAYWKGVIEPFSRSSEVVSSLDVMPTLSTLAGIDLPPNRVIDGRDMSDVLLRNGKSKHEFLFIYGTCHLGNGPYGISAVRHEKYKAHFCTSPGGGGNQSLAKRYTAYPLLFDVEKDPSESTPISTGDLPPDIQDQEAMGRIMKAYAMEVATFVQGRLTPAPDGPGEGPGKYGICCDRSKECDCSDANSIDDGMFGGLFSLGTKQHHDRYHEELGEDQPSPPATLAQALLNEGDGKIYRIARRTRKE